MSQTSVAVFSLGRHFTRWNRTVISLENIVGITPQRHIDIKITSCKKGANVVGIFNKNTLVEKTQFLDGNFNQNSMIMSSHNQLQ